MKNALIFTLTIIALIFTTSSCGNKGCTDPLAANYLEEANKDDGSCEYAPTIMIDSPNSNMKSPGDTISIQIHVTDDDQIQEISSKLTCFMNDSIYWSDDSHPNANEHHVMSSCVMGLPQGISMSDFTLLVTATDHTGNESETSVTFHVM